MVVQAQTTLTVDSSISADSIRASVARLRQHVGARIADEIVDRSPVDTGTYILAHIAKADATPESATRSSEGKPRRQNRAQYQNLARGNLKRSVSAIAARAGTDIWFRNRAFHADKVEHLGWGGTQAHHVYAVAAATANALLPQYAQEIGFTSR